MRAPILKTYKLFIGGQFPRTESGHYYQICDPRTKKPLANVCRGSRKDLREAVKAARGALSGWSGKTAYNRGQILYRMAEVLEKRKAELIEEIDSMMRAGTRKRAEQEVEQSIDRLVWYAGWSDKYQQIFGSVNPVALPYFNFTLPEPMGVVGIVCPEGQALLPLVSQLAPALIGGNTVVILASEKFPLPAITFGEVCETSDVPAGVVNILTGPKKELLPHLAKHMDVNAIHTIGPETLTVKLLQEEGSANVKRIVVEKSLTQSPYWITALTEMKTTWHPVGV